MHNATVDIVPIALRRESPSMSVKPFVRGIIRRAIMEGSIMLTRDPVIPVDAGTSACTLVTASMKKSVASRSSIE